MVQIFWAAPCHPSWMVHYNRFPTPTRVEANLGADDNDPEANKDWPN